jgi:MFS family permease
VTEQRPSAPVTGSLDGVPRGRSVFAPAYRTTTFGVLITMTIIAFEAMAVATAMPTAAASLHGLSAYGWTFTGFLVASVVGMVSSGIYCDRFGVRLPVSAGLVLFIAGLVLGSAAQQMSVLVTARFLQGLATGVLITALYVLIGEIYDDAIRPRIFAALASAWVVPGLVGPLVAGWLTEHLSWRWVFGGLAPFVVIGGVLVLRALTGVRTHTASGAPGDPRRIGYAVLAAAGIAGVAGLGESLSIAGGLVAAVGAVAMVVGLRRLLPAGTVRFAPGVPAAVAFRGVLAGIFFGMEAVVPLTLTVQHHFSPTASGVPLMLTALSWAVGSQIQGRLTARHRQRLVGGGLLLISSAGVGMALVAIRAAPGWAAYLAWPVAGLGAGFALTSTSVTMLEATTDERRGSDSAALQLADSSCSALCTALSGALVAAAATGRISYAVALGTGFGLFAALGALAVTRRGRLVVPSNSPGPSGAVGLRR